MGWIFAMRIGCWRPTIVSTCRWYGMTKCAFSPLPMCLRYSPCFLLAHAERGEESRIISFRKAGAEEREMYHERLENDFTD